MNTNPDEPAVYEWTATNKLHTSDGRTIEIIHIRALTGGQRMTHWFLREITATHIRDHHFPEIRTYRAICAEAVHLAVERRSHS